MVGATPLVQVIEQWKRDPRQPLLPRCGKLWMRCAGDYVRGSDMIITDEELLALLNSEETDERLFHPVTIYALDGVAYRTAKAVELPEFATLRRTRPDACWQWEGLFAAGAIALFDPDPTWG